MKFIVQTTDGVLVKDNFDNLEDAEASAAERNRRAEALGIVTRYEGVTR